MQTPESPLELVDAWIRQAIGEHRSRYVQSHRTRYAALIGALDRLPTGSEAKVLEVGAGDGFFGALLQHRYGWQLTGIDCLAPDVALCEARGVRALVCDVDQDPIPAEDEAFDVVLFDSVLEHLYNPSFALAEARRVLAPGGYLVLGTPNATALPLRIRALAGRNPFERLNRFSAIEGRAFMRECAVFYTPAEVARALGDTIAVQDVIWTNLFDPNRDQRPAWRTWVTPLRLAAVRVHPSLRDFFYLVARKVTLAR